MNVRHVKKMIYEGKYVAEVGIDLLESDLPWAPLLSLDDAYKLDDVRDALKRDDLKRASELAMIYSLTPIAMQKSGFH